MSTEYLSERVKGIFLSKIREVMEKTKRLKAKGLDIVDFSMGRTDFDTPYHIKEVAKKALDQGMVHYTTSVGTISLREAISLRMKQDYNLETNPSEIIVTTGSTEAIYIATQTMLNPGDEFLIPDPMYVYYEGWSFLGGAKAVNFPFDILINNPQALKQYITENTKLLILTSPHNPTGQVIKKDSLEIIADLAKENDFYVISDDVYYKILYDNLDYCNIALFEKMKERTMIIGSLSKAYSMDGWRVGYLIGPKEMIDQALKMHQHVENCPNTFVQEGAKIALTSSQSCVDKMVSEFDRRRRLMMSFFDELKIPYARPQGAFFIFPNISKYGMTSKEFCDFLLEEAKVAAIPGDAFGKYGEGYVRFAYTKSYENIEKGLNRIKKALDKLVL